MRLHLNINVNQRVVPFNYQPMLTSAIHKWIGRNEIHDQISFYSFSWLQNGKATNNGLEFKNNAVFFISAHDNNLLKQIVRGINSDNTINDNLYVKEVLIQDDPSFSNEMKFQVASPIFIKRSENERDIQYTWQNPKSNALLTETLQHKLRKAGLYDKGVKVSFDRNYHSPRTKLIYYKGIGNKVNLCPITINGSREQITFAWNVGIGNSTGIGFGSLK